MLQVVLALVLVLPAGLFGDGARPARAAAGDLDGSFDGDGFVVNSLANFNVSAVALQPDGKIVVVGHAPLPNVQPDRDGFVVARYLPDGHLDQSFGSGGMVQMQVGVGQSFAVALAIQADGKIVVGGDIGSGTQGQFALVRYTPAGQIDTGFGSGGTVLTRFSSGAFNDPTYDHLQALAIQLDGKIVAGGRSGPGCVTPQQCAYAPALARYNPDGSLDTSFGSGGKMLGVGGLSPAAVGYGRMALQADGKIVIHTGQAYPGTRLYRFNPNGSVDTTFGTAGMLAVEDIASPVLALQADGKLLLAGERITLLDTIPFTQTVGFALARLMPNGTPDATFGTGGRFTTGANGPSSVTSVTAVVVQPDGKVVVGGGDGVTGFVLTRFTPGGSPDVTFGAGGEVRMNSANSALSGIAGLVLLPDGKLVVAGRYNVSGILFQVLARYQGSGGGVGGKSLAIAPQQSSVALRWNAGTEQTGYLLGRSPSATWTLPAGATTYTDAAPGPSLNCYQMLALGPSSVLAASDALCALLGTRSPAGAPPGFVLRLDQSSTARMTWNAPGDQLGYALMALPQSGQPQLVSVLSPATTGADHVTNGAATCYALYAIYEVVLGNTDLVCAVPGQSYFGTASAGAGGTAARGTAATERQAATHLDGRTAAIRQEATKKLPAARQKVEGVAAQVRGTRPGAVPGSGRGVSPVRGR